MWSYHTAHLYFPIHILGWIDLGAQASLKKIISPERMTIRSAEQRVSHCAAAAALTKFMITKPKLACPVSWWVPPTCVCFYFLPHDFIYQNPQLYISWCSCLVFSGLVFLNMQLLPGTFFCCVHLHHLQIYCYFQD